MTKNETVNRTQNADLSEKSGQLQLWKEMFIDSDVK